MPTFCRHNRLIQNCPICSREQAVPSRPLITPGAPRSSQPQEHPRRKRVRAAAPAPGSGLRIRRLARGVDDGYRTPLAPGLRSSADAERLADELAFAATRLAWLERDPPGLYDQVAHGDGDREERTWLAFLIAYLGPVDGDDPFESIRTHINAWADNELPSLEEASVGPRGAHEPSQGPRTLAAYRAWAARAGSQAAAFTGETEWSPERRFSRIFERLSLPGLHRNARFDLLLTLGRVGLYPLRAGSLQLGGENEVTLAAKRAFGIGDPLLLERRASELATESGLPLDALDLGLFNWERGERTSGGLPSDTVPDAAHTVRVRSVFGLPLAQI